MRKISRILKKYVGNMKNRKIMHIKRNEETYGKYEGICGKYEENMKECEENMKEYEEICGKYAYPSYFLHILGT